MADRWDYNKHLYIQRKTLITLDRVWFASNQSD